MEQTIASPYLIWGSNNNSGILANSKMGKMFEEDLLNVPPDCKLSEDDERSLPYFLLGDEIFPLKKWLMRPYPGKNASDKERIYNYQHSRARRCIGNAFGILTASWRIFHKPIRATAENVYYITFLHAWPCITIWELRAIPIAPLLVLSTLRTKMKIFFLDNGDCKKKMV